MVRTRLGWLRLFRPYSAADTRSWRLQSEWRAGSHSLAGSLVTRPVSRVRHSWDSSVSWEREVLSRARLGSTEVADLMDTLGDANDTILERIGMNLDEAAGIKKEADPLLLEVSQKFVAGGGSWNNFNRQQSGQPSASSPVRLLGAKNVVRPQVKFSKLVDNSERPFLPRLTENCPFHTKYRTNSLSRPN